MKNASLEAGDWIAQIKLYASDVAPGAAVWWENLELSRRDTAMSGFKQIH